MASLQGGVHNAQAVQSLSKTIVERVADTPPFRKVQIHPHSCRRAGSNPNAMYQLRLKTEVFGFPVKHKVDTSFWPWQKTRADKCKTYHLAKAAVAPSKPSEELEDGALGNGSVKTKLVQRQRTSTLSRTQDHTHTPYPSRNPKSKMAPGERQLQSGSRMTSAAAVEYMAAVSGLIEPDGGPPRWFCPLDARPRLGEPGSAKEPLPSMFYLPGIDGTGMGAVFQHKALARLFKLECLHCPAADRSSFQDLVDLVAKRVRAEHEANPKLVIYLLGESFGAMQAMAVAAQHPNVPLRLVLINPTTCFQQSPLQPYIPLFRLMPQSLYQTLPFLLSFNLANPLRLASAGIPLNASPLERAQGISSNLVAILTDLPLLAEIFPQETLGYKMDLLDVGSRYVNSILEAVKAPSLLLPSGEDGMLPSKAEARRLFKILPNCKIRDLPESGHCPMLEDGVDVATSIKASGFYKRTMAYEDPITNFVGPSEEDLERVRDFGFIKYMRQLSSPVSFSTLDDGTVVQGCEGVPADEAPLLFIGNHQTFAVDLSILVDEILKGTGILVRGLAHPSPMGIRPVGEEDDGNSGSSMEDFFRTFGAVEVNGANLYKLMATRQSGLLFPGGVREALKHKGEEYKLIWPDQPEFVRMAVRHGAVIIPFAAIGVDDAIQMLLDSTEVKRLPIIGPRLVEDAKRYPKARAEGTAFAAEDEFVPPVIAPGPIRRFYFLFQKPIRTQGLKHVMNDKEKTAELYWHVKGEVEAGLQYLLRKREEDPYKDLVPRLIYEASRGGQLQAPTFRP